jgi:hypothetical protein
VEITSLRRTDGKLQGAPPLALAARHEQWSQAATQLLRLAQARSAARLHRETVASTCARGESIASRAKRCTGYGLSACLVGSLMLLVLVNAADRGSGGADESGSDALMSGAGVTAYLVLTTALGLLCFAGGMHARARHQRNHLDRAVTRVEELTREFDDQKARVLTTEHALRIGYVRASLDEASMPDVLTTLVTDYVEPPQGTVADGDAGLRRHDERCAPAIAEAVRRADRSPGDTQDPP